MTQRFEHPLLRPALSGLATVVACLCLAGCPKTNKPPAPTAAAASQGAAPADARHADAAGIAWRHASADADVDAAFALARKEGKPVFVYWGAKWCPPCNQVKATLFNRRDFIERSRAFVPVYVDGDAPGAQKLGARFHVSGYPTMVLFDSKGIELTRLPGEVEPARYTEVLTLGMNAQRPASAVLRSAEAGGAGLTPSDWRLLAFYSWDTDQQLVDKRALPALLERLAAACPADQVESATRLRLKALAARAEKGPVDSSAQALLLRVLADADVARSHIDVLANEAAHLVAAASRPASPERGELVHVFDAALARFEADATLSRADRLGALIARVDLAKLEASELAGADEKPALPGALIADVREQAARADREITDAYERQAVITAAALLLQEAGLGEASDALLTANLARSHSPYYLMSQLAGNAKKRGDAVGALAWYEKAYAASEGPATRLQWGSSYVNALIDLAPRDERRIEAAAQQLFREAAAQPDAFYERSGRSLQRVGAKLAAWNERGTHSAVLGRLQAQLDGVCNALSDVDRKTRCDALLKPASSGKTA